MSDTCRKICERAQQVGFVDPLSKLPPRDEVSLSALLCLYHQADSIAWKQVPLALPSGESSSKAADAIFGCRGYLCSEYPLFWNSHDEREARGGMRPDFLFLSVNHSVAAFIEHKIGGGFAHKGDAYGGQLGRYLKYLVDTRVPKAYLVLLTSQFLARTPPWYVKELEVAHKLQSPNQEAEAFVMTWESILDSLRRRKQGVLTRATP